MRLLLGVLAIGMLMLRERVAGVQPLCSRACCFNRKRMFSERRMGTPARLMASKSVKSDQPTIKATSPRASGWYWERTFVRSLCLPLFLSRFC